MEETTVLQQFSCNLKSIRDESGLSVALYADTCGILVNTFKNYLYGNSLPSLETIAGISDATGTPIARFFYGLANFPTEVSSIKKIEVALEKLPQIRRSFIESLLEPLKISIIYSFPDIRKANFGTRLKVLRLDIGYTIENMSQKCGISEKTYRAYESSQSLPGLLIFLDICKELRTSPEYLLCKHVATCSHRADTWLYDLTPRQIEGLAVTVERLCLQYEN